MKDSNFKKQIILLSIIVLSSITTNTWAQEAYVEMSQDLTTLTFYYDTQKANRKGTVYELNQGDKLPEWCETIFMQLNVQIKCSEKN